MPHTLRIDTHAHLYDDYSVKEWCYAAVRNLGGCDEVCTAVCVVDRDGQDSLARLRREVPSFGEWRDLWKGLAGIAHLGTGSLLIVRGVQYVTSERIEVLGLGVERFSPDGSSAGEYISRIEELNGLACLPWSPGKWLGARGKVVKALLDTYSANALVVGDISMRSRFGPPSTLLPYARKKGFPVLFGTDPLPSQADERLVGSFGSEISLTRSPDELLDSWATLKEILLSSGTLRPCGARNSALQAARRFVSSVR
jgi:hypothetical protein